MGQGLSFRDGAASDLPTTFAISERAIYRVAAEFGTVPPGSEPTDAEIAASWRRRRPLVEFLAAQQGGRYLICESGAQPVGYARVVNFGEVDELTDLMVAPEYQGRGIGRELLVRCWRGAGRSTQARLVVATGAPRDLSLYTEFGLMPLTGHWQLRQRARSYRARRSEQPDTSEPDVHVLTPERAVSEWTRLEPSAVGHARPHLHDFFARDRSCLACVAGDGRANALCWVSGDGEIGPAVAASAEALAPVVLAALDRVARTLEPEYLTVFATTASWALLHRLRTLGFRVWWPGWVMASGPLGELDRYAPTRPPVVL